MENIFKIKLDKEDFRNLSDFEKFESFIKLYPKVLAMADHYKKSPGDLITLFASIGQMAVEKTNPILIDAIGRGIKDYVVKSDLKVPEKLLNALEDIIQTVKATNAKN